MKFNLFTDAWKTITGNAIKNLLNVSEIKLLANGSDGSTHLVDIKSFDIIYELNPATLEVKPVITIIPQGVNWTTIP